MFVASMSSGIMSLRKQNGSCYARPKKQARQSEMPIFIEDLHACYI